MTGLEFQFNREQAITAGLRESNGVITLIISMVQKNNKCETHLDLTGLDSDKNEKLVWTRKQLEVGDEFSLKIVQNVHVELPKIEPETCKPSLENKLASYKKLQAELREAGLIN